MLSWQSFGQRVAIETVVNDRNSIKIFSSYYNKVNLLVENTPCDSILLKSNNLEIINISPCVYYLRVLRKDEWVLLSVFDRNKFIKEYDVVVDEAIPMPKVEINGIKAMERGTILTSKADSVYCLPVLNDKYNMSISFTVVAFKVTLKRGNNVIFAQKMEGNKFSIEMKKYLQDLKYKDLMFLEQIVIEDNYKNLYRARDAVFGAY